MVVVTQMECEVTAYVRGGNTATGSAENCTGVAVDPDVIPYGSCVYIPSVGWRIADDCGPAINGKMLDLRLNTHDECMTWGRRTLRVTIRTYTGGETSRGGARRDTTSKAEAGFTTPPKRWLGPRVAMVNEPAAQDVVTTIPYHPLTLAVLGLAAVVAGMRIKRGKRQ